MWLSVIPDVKLYSECWGSMKMALRVNTVCKWAPVFQRKHLNVNGRVFRYKVCLHAHE